MTPIINIEIGGAGDGTSILCVPTTKTDVTASRGPLRGYAVLRVVAKSAPCCYHVWVATRANLGN